MRRCVWKYQLALQVDNHISIPAGAQILHVGTQYGEICLWALVDPGALQESRSFAIVGTGHQEIEQDYEYIGTVSTGPYWWHVFEVPRG